MNIEKRLKRCVYKIRQAEKLLKSAESRIKAGRGYAEVVCAKIYMGEALRAIKDNELEFATQEEIDALFDEFGVTRERGEDLASNPEGG